MRTAVLTAPRTFAIEDHPVRELKRDEVLIQVATCGICTGELERWADEANKNLPARIGHEVAGTIVAVGDEVTSVRPGDQVAAINDREGFAEFCVTAADRVAKLPTGLDLRIALGEPLACAVNAARRIRPDYMDTVVMVGSGFMGLLLMQCLKARSPRQFIAIDTRDEAVERAKALGADIALNATKVNVKEAVAELTGGTGADIVIEASGTQAGLSVVGDLIRIRGHLVIYGYHQGAPRQVNMQQWNYKGLDITNAHERDYRVYVAGMKAGLDLVARGQIRLSELITHRYSLGQINDGFALAHSKAPGYVKATVDMEG